MVQIELYFLTNQRLPCDQRSDRRDLSPLLVPPLSVAQLMTRRVLYAVSRATDSKGARTGLKGSLLAGYVINGGHYHYLGEVQLVVFSKLSCSRPD